MNCPSVQHLCRPSVSLQWRLVMDAVIAFRCGVGDATGMQTGHQGMQTGHQGQLLPGRLIASFSLYCYDFQHVVSWPAAATPGNLFRNAVYLASSQTSWIRNSGGEAQLCGFQQAFQRVPTHAPGGDPPCYYILGQLGQSRFKDGLPWWLSGKKKSPPANAGDTCLIPGPGRSHMPQSN